MAESEDRRLELTPGALKVITAMEQRIARVALEYGKHSPEHVEMLGLVSSLATMLRLGGRITPEDELSLFGASFIAYGVIFHPNRSGDQPDPLLGSWVGPQLTQPRLPYRPLLLCGRGHLPSGARESPRGGSAGAKRHPDHPGPDDRQDRYAVTSSVTSASAATVVGTSGTSASAATSSVRSTADSSYTPVASSSS